MGLLTHLVLLLLLVEFIAAQDVTYLKIPDSEGCWAKCGNKGGKCPSICGENAYCCRQGFTDCPSAMAAVANDGPHSCIVQSYSKCGGTVPETARVIKFPQSGNYDSSLQCTWNFEGKSKLKFHFIDIENHSTCNYDSLTVGTNKFCGTNNPPDQNVDGSSLFKFRSDGSVTKAGFIVEIIPAPVCRYGGKKYSPGETFIDDSNPRNCKRCRCGEGGGYGCTLACGLMGMECEKPAKLEYVWEPTTWQPSCSCQVPKCVLPPTTPPPPPPPEPESEDAVFGAFSPMRAQGPTRIRGGAYGSGDDCGNCRILQVALAGEATVKSSYAGAYLRHDVVNSKRSFVTVDGTKAIWYLSEHKMWAAGPIGRIGADKGLHLLGSVNSEGQCPSDKLRSWQFWGKQWEVSKDIKITCARGECPEYNIDFFGNDLQFIDGVTRWQKCAQFCGEHKDCKIWTWLNEDYADERYRQRCNLKSGDTSGRTFLDNVVSGTVNCNAGSERGLVQGVKSARSSDYKLVRGASCPSSFIPLTTNWQECQAAAKSLGYSGDTVGFVDYEYAWGTSRPQGCFYGDGIRFHFNKGAGGSSQGADMILCVKDFPVASQSSTYADLPKNAASNAIDGDMETRSATDDKDMPPWLQLDLGAQVQIGVINIYLYEYAYNNGYYENLKVATKQDLGDPGWTTCYQVPDVTSSTVTVTSPPMIKITDCTAQARFVQVSVSVHPNPQPLYITEIQVLEKAGEESVYGAVDDGPAPADPDPDDATDPTDDPTDDLTEPVPVVTEEPVGTEDPCDDGYIIDDGECVDIDECELNEYYCGDSTLESHECVNNQGSYNCTCKEGYYSEDPHTYPCEDINECELGTHNCGANNAMCVNTNGSFNCTCYSGFIKEGDACVDLDECFLGTHNCTANANCVNTEGSFTCSCNSGYQLDEDDGTCQDIDECRDSDLGEPRHDCNWEQNEVCRNTDGSYTCVCRRGHELINGKCEDIDECATNNGECINAICINIPGCHYCQCHEGFTGSSGDPCEDIDECAVQNGACSHTCSNSPGSYKCLCPAGYVLGGDNRTCEVPNPCETNNGGCEQVCVNNEGSARCECNAGYRVQFNGRCKDINECFSSATPRGGCQHNCINVRGSFSCECRDGYRINQDKKTCTDINECYQRQICGRHGTCQNTEASYNCKCKSGYENEKGNDKTCVLKPTPKPRVRPVKKRVTGGKRRPSTSSKSTGACVNKSPKCKGWAAKGYCHKNKWVKKNCKLACKTCPKAKTAPLKGLVPGKTRGKPKFSKKYTEEECGMRVVGAPVRGGRIVGGKDAKRGEFPWQVGLWQIHGTRETRQFVKLENPFCGGTLIKANVVLTAAHCFKKKGTALSMNPKHYFVKIGDHAIAGKRDVGDQEERVAIKQIIMGNYNQDTQAHDIAMLVLEKKVELKDHVNVACLPKSGIVGSKGCTVTGWGRLLEGGQTSRVLQKLKMPVVSQRVCRNAFLDIGRNLKIAAEKKAEVMRTLTQWFGEGDGKGTKLTDYQMCGGYGSGGKDACQGDSGGPLVCKEQNNRFTLNGIISWGKGCARPGLYGIYTRVWKYVDWINENLPK